MSDYFKSARENMPAKGLIHQLIISSLNKLNLVTRQEFNTQSQVLIRTRLRVEQLEKQLMELQAKQEQKSKLSQE